MNRYHYQLIEPCANCGKEGGGIMGSTVWGHDHMCCSDTCGKRLGKRIENGMTNLKRSWKFSFEDTSKQDMRIRIKQLEKQLRNYGIKPVRG